jgi:UDP-N-acetylmuramate dehydrogenase
MQIIKDYDLTKLNTFGISIKAKFFVELKNESDLTELSNSFEFKNNKKLFLGGGSNVLFTKDFNGIVILNRLKGIEIVKEDEQSVVIKCMGGEIWHDLVIFAVEKGYWGIENLSFIPGTVGAGPVQNIGAYGVEIKDVLESVEAYDIEKGEKKVFKKDECDFAYRSSIFKTSMKDKYFIISVTLKLSKIPKLNTSYKVLKEYLENNKIIVQTSKDISNAVTAIRESKLPDPKEIGNAGSFFKNIYIDQEKFEELLKEHADIPFFEEAGIRKIPSAWLIEKCGWKGKKVGNVGVHEKQALVLVNYGGAKGQEIKDLSEQIMASVLSKFGLILEREVNLI